MIEMWEGGFSSQSKVRLTKINEDALLNCYNKMNSLFFLSIVTILMWVKNVKV